MYCAADISVCRLLVLRWVLFMQVPMLLQYVPYKVDVAVCTAGDFSACVVGVG